MQGSKSTKLSFWTVIAWILFWPFFVSWYIVKWLYKVSQQQKKHEKRIAVLPTQKISNNLDSTSALVKNKGNELMESLLIPEPTRSLLFITEEDTSKIQHAGGIRVTINISTGVIEQEENGFFAEPSLIWAKLPIKRNNWLEDRPMYWPSYSQFSPEHRYQYLRWLQDIEKPTNLSYVFLYFYGLERHLLIGDYNAAVDEILRLLNSHNKGSFRSYATTSLIVASIYRNKMDFIIDKAPFLLEEEVDEALALRIAKGTTMSPEDIISIASRVGFTNKRYINQHPEKFKKHLQDVIDEFESQHGKVLSVFSLKNFRQEESNAFANSSIPEKIRAVKVPQILRDKKFQQAMYNALQESHSRAKNELVASRKKKK